MAPSMPFFADYLFNAVRESNDKESVHLVAWPKNKKQKNNYILISQMNEVRSVVNLVLAERILKGIKVKQPLSLLKIKSDKVKINKEKDLLELIKDEVNVKEIIFDSNISSEIELDMNITEELKEEGTVREIIRFAQGTRKDAGLKPSDEILACFIGDSELVNIVGKNRDFVSKEIRSKSIVDVLENSDIKKEIVINGKSLILEIKKT